MERMMSPEERNLAPRVSASLTPWVSLPDMGRPKMLMLPVPSHCLIVSILLVLSIVSVLSICLLYHINSGMECGGLMTWDWSGMGIWGEMDED